MRRLTRSAAEAGAIVFAWAGVSLIVVSAYLGKWAYAAEDAPADSTKIR